MSDTPDPTSSTNEDQTSTVFSSENSPLKEAETNSLDELWTRIDLHLTKGMPREIYETDIQRVVDYLRKQRVRFKQEEEQGIKQNGKKATGTGTRSTKQKVDDMVKNLKSQDFTF